MGDEVSYLEQEAKARRKAGHSMEDIAASLCITMPRLEEALLGLNVVRVVQTFPPADSIFGEFLACLDRGEILTVHRISGDGTTCFDILPPSHLMSKEWAARLVGIMKGFGWNATVAPRWSDA